MKVVEKGKKDNSYHQVKIELNNKTIFYLREGYTIYGDAVLWVKWNETLDDLNKKRN